MTDVIVLILFWHSSILVHRIIGQFFSSAFYIYVGILWGLA